MRFHHPCFYIFIFLYDARLIPLISALEEFYFFVTVESSAPFGPALVPPKIENFRCYLIDFISRAPRVPKLFIQL